MVDFKEVKEDFLPTLRNINQSFGKYQDDELLLDEVKSQRAKFRGAVDTLGASTPNAEKELLKEPLKEALQNLPAFRKASGLHVELTKN